MLPKNTNEVVSYWSQAIRETGLLSPSELDSIQWSGMFADRQIGKAEELLIALIIKDLTDGAVSIADYNRLFFSDAFPGVGAGGEAVAELIADFSHALIAISSLSSRSQVMRPEISSSHTREVELELVAIHGHQYQVDPLDQAHFALLQADHEIRYLSRERNAEIDHEKDGYLAQYLGVHRVCVTIARLCPSMQADGKVIMFYWPELCDFVDKLADTANKIAKYRL